MHADSPSDWRAGAQLMLLPHNFSANEIQGTGVTPSATMKTVAAPELPQDFRFMPIKVRERKRKKIQTFQKSEERETVLKVSLRPASLWILKFDIKNHSSHCFL
jgi:hypothetical protein